MWVPDWLIDPMPAEIYPSSGQAKHGLLKVLIVATSLVSRFPRVQQAGIFFGASSFIYIFFIGSFLTAHLLAISCVACSALSDI